MYKTHDIMGNAFTMNQMKARITEDASNGLISKEECRDELERAGFSTTEALRAAFA